MRKSGLQKQISSIFNDAPIPVSETSAPMLPRQCEMSPVSNEECSDGVDQVHMEEKVEQKPSLSKRMAVATTEAVHTPAAPALRPRPLAKAAVKPLAGKSNSDVAGQIKKVLLGSKNAQMDPRQKKMTIMVGALSVVFAAVLFISLGGLGNGKKTSKKASDTPDTTQTVQNEGSALQWHSPQPMPEQLRNPMDPVVVQAVEEVKTAGSRQMLVRGIVFSKTRPTAIVNDKIVAEGETINGATVIKIDKETVEFEKEGNRWTQPVQR